MLTLPRHSAAHSAATRITKDHSPTTGEQPVSLRFGNRALTWRQIAGMLEAADAEALRGLVERHEPLSKDVGNRVAAVVQGWAHAHGATHYSHWFHPLTGIPADKHDAILGFSYASGDPEPIEDFSGSKLLQGEPDASSFPSGGLRETGAARGYTAWDPTSPIFVRADGGSRTLCIPCAFVSWTGHALDHKTPLLRARDAVSRAALRVLRALGSDDGAARVNVTLGSEQEYFLIDRAFLASRPDILMAHRTLLGAPPSRNQQLEDHYFAAIPARVQAFITEVEEELWALGVPVKTRHNEVAPAQFETAPVFEELNIACDHNVLTMDVLRRVAERHGLLCLLHEKPFAGVNGSGKHNNWSLATDTGVNLLDPGTDPINDDRFLVFLAGTLLALSRHAAPLRATIASAGNDHRLGANEAPPPILSAYLGAALDSVVRAILEGADTADLPTDRIPADVAHGIHLQKDPGDRNRTSPFAFTGNKFEFRAVGSSENPAWPQAVLNGAVTDALHEVADRLEAALRGDADRGAAVRGVVRDLLAETRHVCFEGNNYSVEWREEAARRGLPILPNTPASLAVLFDEEQTSFLVRAGVFTADEIASRAHIYVERYVKQIAIEAETLCDIARTLVVPALERQIEESGRVLHALNGNGRRQHGRVHRLGDHLDAVLGGIEVLGALLDADDGAHGLAAARTCADAVIPAMVALRGAIDAAERDVADHVWPLPRYREMLFLGV